MSKRHSFKYINTVFSRNKCVLLSTEYKNNKQLLDYICSCGLKNKISFDNFVHGHRCQSCRNEKLAKDRRLSYSYVKEFFGKNGYELITKTYKNSQTFLNALCPKKHNIKIIFNAFQRGVRCKFCYVNSKSGNKSPWWNPDRNNVKTRLLIRLKSQGILQRTLKSTNQKRANHTYNMLGWTPALFWDYITNHPNFIKLKNTKWELDHIFPIKAFIDYGITNIKLINCLENLQPITREENIKKRDKYNRQEFKIWLKQRGIEIE